MCRSAGLTRTITRLAEASTPIQLTGHKRPDTSRPRSTTRDKTPTSKQHGDELFRNELLRMTTIETAPPPAEVITTTTVERSHSSVAAWLTTTDHKRIGRLLVGTGLTALLGIAAVGTLL